MKRPKLVSLVSGYARAAARLTAFVVPPNDRLIAYTGWVGHSNLGDEAMLEAVQRYFQAYAVRYAPAFSNRTARSMIARKKPSIAMLGGGTLLGSAAWKEVFEISSSSAATNVVFGTGVLRDPRSGRPADSLRDWKPVLEKCRYLGVREEASANILSDIGITAEVLGDPACRFVLDDPSRTRSERKLGVNFGGAGHDGEMWGSPDDTAEAIAQALGALRSKDWRFRFFVVWPEDVQPTLQLMERAGVSDVSTVVCTYRSGTEFVERAKDLTAFLGFKLHAVLLALCAHVPTLMLAYRPKGVDFMHSIGMADFTIQTDQVTKHWIVERIEDSVEMPLSRAIRQILAFRELQQRRAQEIGSLP